MRNEWRTLRDKVVGLQVGGKCLYLIVKSPRVSHHGKNVEGGVVMHCQESKPWTEEQDKQKMQNNPMESMLAREAGEEHFMVGSSLSCQSHLQKLQRCLLK